MLSLLYYVLFTVIGGTGCGIPPNPLNGQVTVMSSTMGDFAVYTCDDGFILDGTNVRQCLLDNTYAGMAPTCRRKKRLQYRIN